ncbi:hypothetical protein [Micromonospora lutea]|uniref:Uncharacterized protein n=1 Tax=Micromonospora lutea TaxID=419825 RepID=A0ABQ4IYC9_9ACTN|nr:hypothetical protein [Micromonospora lutea]GIJ22909.1 hypothetical protein Vlu01_35330 [Micromonospora lutea]
MRLLIEHLWVEGDDEDTFIRLGEHALRVRTNDDEVDLAYYFLDHAAVAASPDRLAFLLHDTCPLPTNEAACAAVFSPAVPIRTVRLVPPGPGSVYSVRLCWALPDINRNLDLPGAAVFPCRTSPVTCPTPPVGRCAAPGTPTFPRVGSGVGAWSGPAGEAAYPGSRA